MDLISIIEKLLNKKAIIQFQDMQPGDIEKSHADIQKSKDMLGYVPSFDIELGVSNFINWYKTYNKIM